MAEAAEILDLRALLTPIAGASPAGIDLRQDFSPQSLYFQLRDARAEARAAERAADASGGDHPTPPQWRVVRELAVKALQGFTKDLEIAAWCTEALVRADGLDGLAAGARLLAGLTEAYWDQGLFPLPDEDGVATRVAPVTGLNGQGADGTLIQPIRKLSLFNRPDGGKLFYYQYEDAATVAGIADAARRQARLAAGSLAFAEVETWADVADPAQLARGRDSALAAIAAWGAMRAAFDAKAGADSPATSRVRDLLATIADLLRRYAPEVADAAPGTDIGTTAPADTPIATEGTPVVSRDDMLRDLARIADWFRRTEPHSPLAYTIDDAVRRGRMTLPELLAEVIDDAGARGAMLNRLGIRLSTDGAG